MNIPISNILSKIEQELNKAKVHHSKEELKARLLVIRSLCDVVLDHDEVNDFTEIKEPSQKNETFTPLELEKMMGIKKAKDKPKPISRYLEEEDANGESIFDF